MNCMTSSIVQSDTAPFGICGRDDTGDGFEDSGVEFVVVETV